MSAHLQRSLPGLLVILSFIVAAGALVHAQEAPAPKPAAPLAVAGGLFVVPEGTPEETLKFLEALKEDRPANQNREAVISHYRRVFATVAAATDKLLKAELPDELRNRVLTSRLESLGVMSQLSDASARKLARELATKVQTSDDRTLALMARRQLLQITLMEVLDGASDQSPSLVSTCKSYLDAGPPDVAHLRMALQVTQGLEQAGEYKAALEVNEMTKAAYLQAKDPELAAAAAQLTQVTQKRLGVVGTKLDLAGTLLSGKPLDWSKFQGKVVLVDFWATWCGPCRAELPNIKQNYEKYHKQGFEVLGISLDEDRKAIERFVAAEELPWQNLFSDDPKQNQELADRYGVQGIPALLLIGRDGKVITLKARGSDLGGQLEKLFGKTAAKPITGK